MNRNSFLLIISLVLLFTACKKDSDVSPYNEYINGLATPIQMNVGYTDVFLNDYFSTDVEFDSIVGHERLRMQYNENTKRLGLSNRGSLPAFSLLRFYIQGDRVDIPVLRSRKVAYLYQFKPKNTTYKNVSIVGDMNAWNPAEGQLKNQNGTWIKALHMAPGTYNYQLEADGKRILDNGNSAVADNGNGGHNSVLVITGTPEDKKPKISLVETESDRVVVKIKNAGVVTALWQNQETAVLYSNDQTEIMIPAQAKALERSYLRLWTHSENAVSGYTLVPLENGNVIQDASALDREDPHTNIMYFAMVDRFNNGDKSNDFTVDDPAIHERANFKGGDLQGITKKISEGYFKELGINNIWISPVVSNPDSAYGFYNKEGITSKFSAYHGYWPNSFTKVSTHFGGETALKDLVKNAHKKEMNVTLDFIANHVHESHPVYQANKDKGWATNLYLPDGSLNTEKWDEHRLTTWFDVFLPSLNLEKQSITEMLSDSAMYWLETYDLDGFRHDATKHIPLNFWRTLTKKVKSYEASTGKNIIQLGETYGVPELINSYINTGMLDGQFDFNVYDALVASIAKDDVGFEKAAERIMQSKDYYGSNHIMGNISGNQDRARFMAYATGEIKFNEDSKYAGWSRLIDDQTPEGYSKLGILHAINMTIPGIPVIYYGDEIGMTGGNDPDNRRMMHFDDWNNDENAMFETVSKLANLRLNEMSLLYGDFQFVKVNKDILVYVRSYFDQHTIVIINNSQEDQTIEFNINDLKLKDGKSLFGHAFDHGEYGNFSIDLPALSFEIIHN
jgi:glycosidase